MRKRGKQINSDVSPSDWEKVLQLSAETGISCNLMVANFVAYLAKDKERAIKFIKANKEENKG